VSHTFNSKQGPIVVEAEITGPSRSMTVPLILDTGATTSLLKEAVLLALGFDLVSVTDRVQMTTGSTVISVPRVVLTRLTAMGRHQFGFPVLAYSLPAAVSVSGLIGLDFLRNQVLTIDFRAGQITLA
jgi:predicted aspartyl protease